MQHFLLQRNIDFLIAIASTLSLVVERPHKRIGKEHPGKTFGIEVVRHHGPVRDTLLDVQLVEQIGKIRVALAFLNSAFFCTSHLA